MSQDIYDYDPIAEIIEDEAYWARQEEDRFADFLDGLAYMDSSERQEADRYADFLDSLDGS